MENPLPKLSYFSVEGTDPVIHLLTVYIQNNGGERLQKHRITFICDCSGSMGNTYSQILIPSIKSYYQKLSPFDCFVVLFGKNITTYSIKDTNTFKEFEMKELENATDIAGGIETAITDAITFYNNENTDRNYTQIFFFASDGDHNASSKSKLESVIEECGKNVRNSGMNCLFLVVGIGSSSNTSYGMKAKREIQTITTTGEYPIHYARDNTELENVLKQLEEEHLQAIYGKVIQLSFKSQEPNSGLLRNFISPPSEKISQLALSSQMYSLYQGDPSVATFSLSIENEDFSIVPQKMENSETIPLVTVLRETFSQLAIMGVTSQNTETIKSQVEILDKILHYISEREFSPCVKSPVKRIQMMREIREGVTNLRHQLNEIKDKIRHIFNASNAEQAQFLRKAADMKYGSRAMRRGTTVKSKEIYENTKKIFTQYKFSPEELAHDRCSIFSTATESEHYQMIYEWVTNNDPQLSDLDIIEMLYGFGSVGYLINVSRNDASYVDPWTIKVEYISSDLADTASAVCSLKADHELKDLSKNKTEDVLVIINPKNPIPGKRFFFSKLYKTYNSLVFTRNLDLSISDQKSSLLFHSFVKSVYQFMENPDLRTLKHMRIFTDILYTAKVTCFSSGKKSFSQFWIETEKKNFSDTPGMYLTSTERDAILSLVQILVLLCVKRHPVIDSTKEEDIKKWELLKMSILSEGIAREMKIYAKGRNLLENTEKISLEMLEIKEDSCIKPKPVDEEEPLYKDEDHSSEYSEELIIKISESFDKYYRMKEILRTLSFIEVWQRYFFGENKYKLNILKTISEEELEKFFVNFREILISAKQPEIPPIVKATMILQGLKYPNTKDRRDGIPLVHTEELAKEQLVKIVRELRISIYRKNLSEKKKIIAMREAKLQQEEREKAYKLSQEEFMKHHKGNARAFTQKEIDILNKTRPISDQLEILKSHMLKNHCGYPDCPYYLKNLSTESDIKYGTNDGLWNHLHPGLYPKLYIIPFFHSKCFTVLRNTPNITKEEFVSKMVVMLQQQLGKNSDAIVIGDIEDVWKVWQNFDK